VLPVIASQWVRDRAESAGRLLGKAGWKPGSDMTAIWQGFTSLGDAQSRRAFLATTRSVIDPGGQSVSAHDYLPDTLPVPTLIVWGSRDRMIPAWHALKAQKSMPQCRVELFEGAGHFPHLDEPDRFADLLCEYIASTPAAAES
jgi:pimeloyl-ACP methyl ester carboxylesterase